ncbi:MAG: type IV toxin-antitoxin system AbiEi family antitoxin [Iamia sp.]
MLEALELDQPRVVTEADLARLASARGVAIGGRQLAYELRRRGWLVGLRTKGAWEFAPAARAGRYSSGDRHIELRAARAVDRGFPGALAMESAAVALGLAGRVPDRDVLWVPPGLRVPKSFGDWRVVHLAVGDDGIESVDSLPTWRVETLLTGMARRPDGFHDWPNVAEWLDRAVSGVDAETVGRALTGAPRAAWQRAAYLLAMGGDGPAGVALFEQAPSGRGPAYLGPRQRKGQFDKRFEIVDSVLAASFSGVQP